MLSCEQEALIKKMTHQKILDLGDHLGNVLATLLDRKTGAAPTVGGLYDHWNADVR